MQWYSGQWILDSSTTELSIVALFPSLASCHTVWFDDITDELHRDENVGRATSLWGPERSLHRTIEMLPRRPWSNDANSFCYG